MSLMPTKLQTHHSRMDRAVPAGGGDTVYSKISQGEFAKILANEVYLSQKYVLKYKYTKCLKKYRSTNNGLDFLVKRVTKLLSVIRVQSTQVTLFLPKWKFFQGSK